MKPPSGDNTRPRLPSAAVSTTGAPPLSRLCRFRMARARSRARARALWLSLRFCGDSAAGDDGGSATAPFVVAAPPTAWEVDAVDCMTLRTSSSNRRTGGATAEPWSSLPSLANDSADRHSFALSASCSMRRNRVPAIFRSFFTALDAFAACMSRTETRHEHLYAHGQLHTRDKGKYLGL